MQTGAFAVALSGEGDSPIMIIDWIAGLFGIRRKEDCPPDGVVKMQESMKELEESSIELRNKLNEHPEYLITHAEPLREHIVPNRNDLRRK